MMYRIKTRLLERHIVRVRRRWALIFSELCGLQEITYEQWMTVKRLEEESISRIQESYARNGLISILLGFT